MYQVLLFKSRRHLCKGSIVGRNMLRSFGHRVATCWVLLAQICPFSFLGQQHPTCRSTHFHFWANNTQHVAAHRNTVAKRTQHVAPNNVAICCVGMLRSFGRGLRDTGDYNPLRDLEFKNDLYFNFIFLFIGKIKLQEKDEKPFV